MRLNRPVLVLLLAPPWEVEEEEAGEESFCAKAFPPPLCLLHTLWAGGGRCVCVCGPDIATVAKTALLQQCVDTTKPHIVYAQAKHTCVWFERR